ncbi:MAG: nitrilase-related carbon-nitrogen hydrolase [Candidatus Methanofastidiosia archaeon]
MSMINVAYVQMEPVFLDREENLSTAAKLLESVKKADITVLPELFNTGYNFREKPEMTKLAEDAKTGPTSLFLQEVAKEYDQYIAAGFAERIGDMYYNSQLLVGPEGFIHSYQKIHLFFNEKKFFAPGNTFKVIDIGIARIGQMVCFDWFFPEAMRTLMLMGADIVLHSANLVLPNCPDAMVTRCFENKVFAVTSNRIGEEFGMSYIGLSQITSCDGKILHRAPKDREEAWIEEIDPQRARDKNLNQMNNIREDRRSDIYRA